MVVPWTVSDGPINLSSMNYYWPWAIGYVGPCSPCSVNREQTKWLRQNHPKLTYSSSSGVSIAVWTWCAGSFQLFAPQCIFTLKQQLFSNPQPSTDRYINCYVIVSTSIILWNLTVQHLEGFIAYHQYRQYQEPVSRVRDPVSRVRDPTFKAVISAHHETCSSSTCHSVPAGHEQVYMGKASEHS